MEHNIEFQFQFQLQHHIQIACLALECLGLQRLQKVSSMFRGLRETRLVVGSGTIGVFAKMSRATEVHLRHLRHLRHPRGP
jgi:hypothetical protein